MTQQPWTEPLQAHELPPDLGPWQPQPCDKTLTVPAAPHLALETRSAARARFDAGQEEKALLAEVMVDHILAGSFNTTCHLMYRDMRIVDRGQRVQSSGLADSPLHALKQSMQTAVCLGLLHLPVSSVMTKESYRR